MDDIGKNDEIVRAMFTVEYHPILPDTVPHMDGLMKLPFEKLSSLGVGLSALPECFRTVTQTANVGGDGLWRMFTVPGATGTLQMKNGVTLGTLTGADGAITARARFMQVGGTSVTTKAVMPPNPATLFIAAALLSIEKKLDDIQEVQADMLDFLQTDKRSKIRGNQSFLADILNNYKFNWNNATYKQNMHIKVQDIKQEAEQNILFFRERIKKVLNKRKLILAEQEAKSQLSKVLSDMEDYQLSVYLYGFSSFLEVLLLGNFNAGYLDSIAKKVEVYAIQYRELYTESYNKIESKLESSVEAHLLKGVATVSGAAGKAIAKVPVISKTQIDETLIDSGERVERFGAQRTVKTMQRLVGSKRSFVTPFVSCINTINTLYNSPTEILFDNDCIYIGASSAAESLV